MTQSEDFWNIDILWEPWVGSNFTEDPSLPNQDLTPNAERHFPRQIGACHHQLGCAKGEFKLLLDGTGWENITASGFLESLTFNYQLRRKNKWKVRKRKKLKRLLAKMPKWYLLYIYRYKPRYPATYMYMYIPYPPPPPMITINK